MRFRNIRDVLDWTQTFHEALAREYDQLAENHERERVGLLLRYLAQHERVLSEALKHYEHDEAHETLELWIWHSADVDLPNDVHGLCEKLEKVDTTDVLILTLRFHDLLIDLYQKLLEKNTSPEVRSLFANIIGYEVKEKLNVVRDATRLEDL